MSGGNSWFMEESSGITKKECFACIHSQYYVNHFVCGFTVRFLVLAQTGLHFSVDKNEAKILLNHTFHSQCLRPATSN